MYISELIKDEYKEWEAGQIILISAPTGSGKSNFIFDKLLELAICRRKKILYLVNRRILKMQLDSLLERDINEKIYEKFRNYEIDLEDYINIKTYQWIEEKILTESLHDDVIKNLANYDIVVYDECHYFYADATFNTNTEISFQILEGVFRYKLKIFMSATMEKVKKFIKSYAELEVDQGQRIYWEINRPKTEYSKRMYKWGMKNIAEYTVPTDYSYIKLHSFSNYIDLVKIVNNNQDDEKWLIFIDSIKDGNRLKDGLIESGIPKEDVVFIDADYKKDISASNSVNSITKNNLVEEKIVITTPVLDNGITLQDEELRNLVIFSDTQESFIQMLGRKRSDGKSVNLYICRRSSAFFSKRYEHCNEVLKIYNSLEKIFKRIYPIDMKCPQWPRGGIPFLNYCKRSKYDFCVSNDTLKFHQRIMNEINNDNIYCKAKTFLYSLGGLYAVNSFSIDQYKDRAIYYGKMRDKLKEDSEAFIKQQMAWLKLEEVEDFKKIGQKEYEVNRKSLCEKIEVLFKESLEEVCLDREGNLSLKKDASKELKYFLQRYEKESEKLKQMGQNDHAITSVIFNRIMQEAGLPYIMEKKGRSEFKIRKIKTSEPISKV